MKGCLPALILVLTIVIAVRADTGTCDDLLLRQVIEAYDLRPLPTRPFEEDAKYALGRALFFDPILSGNRDIACATCHLLSRGVSDGLSASIGTGGIGLAEERTLPPGRLRQPRNALDLWNRDNNAVSAMFWDGRVEALDPILRTFRSPLEDRLPPGLENTMAVQALFPLAQDDEMLGVPGDRAPRELPPPHAGQPNELAGQTDGLAGAARIEAVLGLVMNRLLGGEGVPSQAWHAEYRRLFQAAYPDIDADAFRIAEAANAIAHFEEIAFATRETPWDRYLAGDSAAIGEQARRGAFLFFGKARCAVCHTGPLFSDFDFHAIGVRNFGPGYDSAGGDLGRYRVTGDPADLFKFRTPPLRNVTITAPYFHNGSAGTLEEAITQHLDPLRYADKYSESGALMMVPAQLEAVSPVLRSGLYLDEADVDALIAFVQALEDPGLAHADHIIPQSVPSGLPLSVLYSQ